MVSWCRREDASGQGIQVPYGYLDPAGEGRGYGVPRTVRGRRAPCGVPAGRAAILGRLLREEPGSEQVESLLCSFAF